MSFDLVATIHQGIKFLIENGVITDDPESIAEFLHSNVGLDKTELGDYIGEGDAANIKVCRWIFMADFFFFFNVCLFVLYPHCDLPDPPWLCRLHGLHGANV